jgi:hypothetical protein
MDRSIPVDAYYIWRLGSRAHWYNIGPSYTYCALGQESAPAVSKAAEQSSPGLRSPAAANGNGDDGYYDLAAADHGCGTNNENEGPSTASPVVDKDGYMHWGAAQANGGAEPAGSEASAPALHASTPEMPTVMNQIQDEGVHLIHGSPCLFISSHAPRSPCAMRACVYPAYGN